MPQRVRLTRRVTFSSGHRYWFADRTPEENRELFGLWASPYNHGHNYVLDVTVDGEVEERTGMVVNIKTLDEVVRDRIVSQLDGKSLNDEVNFFQAHTSSVENLLRFVKESLSRSGVLPAGTNLVAIRVEETPLLYGEMTHLTGSWKTSITRVYEFAAAHRLHSESLSQDENLDLFGKCNNPSGHGHNFVLEVTVEGEPNPVTGMIADIGAIDERVNELVVERYDHKHLNVDVPEFSGRVVTSEVLAAEIFKTLDGKLPAKLGRVRLFETARSYFEVVSAA